MAYLAYSQYHGSRYCLYICFVSHTLKLITATLSCSIFLLLKSIVSNLFSTYSARAVTRTPNLHNIRITSILKSHHWLTVGLNQRIQYEVLCLAHKSLKKLVTHRISALCCHLHLTVLLILQISSHSIVLLSLLVLLCQIDLFINLLLSYGIVFLLTYVMPLRTPPLHLLLTLASLTSVFLKKLQSHLFRI